MRKVGAEAPSGTAPNAVRRWNDSLALSLVAIASVLGVVIAARNWPREHDRHVVVSQVRELERSIRSHGPDLWLFVEGNDKRDNGDVDRETRHQVMLRDFERLGRLEGFAITDIVVQIDGDKALATYRVRGVARLVGEIVPRGGQLEFVRRQDSWQVARHQFVR